MSEAMEAVKAFNNELSSLYESKPPVSRAKMARITKSAIKAVKFYKHVVQSVEKFILKCRAEYKVPGLYVVDSIVRQSRHQFGVEKDVFAQRFSKNIVATFQNLVSCPEDERNKIVRVLQLWQKNGVFSPEIMQQLFSMTEQSDDGGAMGASSAAAGDEYLGDNQNSQQSDASDGEEEVDPRSSLPAPKEPTNDSTAEKTKGRSFAEVGDKAPTTIASSQPAPDNGTEAGTNVPTDMLSAVVQLLQSSQQPISQLLQHQLLQQLPQPLGSLSLPQQLLQQLNHPPNSSSSSSMAVSSVPLPPPPAQVQQPMMSHQLPQQQQQQQVEHARPQQVEMLRSAALQFDRRSEENSQGSEPLFNKSLLEFDYGESDDEENRKGIRSVRMEDEIRSQPPQGVSEPTFPNHQHQQHHHQHQHQFHPQTLENSGPQSYQLTSAMPNLPQHLQPFHQQQQQQQPHQQQQLQQLHPNQLFPPQPEDRAERLDYFHGKNLPMWQNENSYERGYEGNYEMQQQQQQNQWQEQESSMFENREQQQQPPDEQRFRPEFEDNNQPPRDRHRVREHDDKRRKRSRDRSRSPRRRDRSRNDSSKRSRSKDRRRRSRSRDRSRRSRSRSQDRNRDRERRERERDRRNRGVPPLIENHLCVCSTTLWIGHLSKHTKENELKEEMSKYGETTSFNLIPPRGCAFISFSSRKDASRALEKLKGSKISGNAIKVAWAMGVGMKESDLKDLWDVEQGVSYIPWNRIPDNVDDLADGGFLDEDSLPEEVKIARKERAKGKENAAAGNSQTGSDTTTIATTTNNRTTAESMAPSLLPPIPTLPPGVMPLLPPPPGFMQQMMVPGGVPPMMRMPPPSMHGMMPPMGGGLLPPPPRMSMPPSSAASMDDSGTSESEKGSEKTSVSTTSECMPPMGPPGMAFPWPMPPNMRPGMMPFRPPFMPPNAFGRMPFLPAPPRFHGAGEPREEVETRDNERKTEPGAEVAEESVEKGEHGDTDPGGVPPPPEGAPHQPWPPGGMGGPHGGGPRPDFMGMRPRAPFGPPGFAGGVPRMPGGRGGRMDMEELPEGEESEQAGGEADIEAGAGGVEEHGFPGPDNRDFPPHFGGPGRGGGGGGRPPWFGGPPRGPPGGPHGMRMPRFPFEDPRMGMRPPHFRLRGPPPGLMGDDPRFNGPPQGFRGRPPFPPRGPGGMPNFRPLMDQPFGRPPFRGRGPRPLFPRGLPEFGYPPDSAEEEYYEEDRDVGEGDPGAEGWNEEAEKGEEEWPDNDGNEDEEAGGYGRRQGHWRGNGRRGEDEGRGRRPWRGNDRRNDEMESGGRWGGGGGGGNRRGDWEDRRGGGRWGGQNRPNRDDEEGGGRRRGGWRQEDEGQSRDRHGAQDDRRPWVDSGDVAEEEEEDEPNPKRGRFTSDERKNPKSAWGEFFNDQTGDVVGLEEGSKEAEQQQQVADRAEKKPRKTRWSSADPVVQPPLELSEVPAVAETPDEEEVAAAEEEKEESSSQLSQESTSLANESSQPPAAEEEEELPIKTTAEPPVAAD